MPIHIIVTMPDTDNLTSFFDAVANSQAGRSAILAFGLRSLRLVYPDPADAASACLHLSPYHRGCASYP